jgi:hypothetical protein
MGSIHYLPAQGGDAGHGFLCYVIVFQGALYPGHALIDKKKKYVKNWPVFRHLIIC